MARPRKEEKDKKIIRTYTVNRELHANVTAKALIDDITVTSIINDALKHYVSN